MFVRNVIRILIAVVAAVATALSGAVAVQATPSDDAAGIGASLSASGRWYGAISMSFDDGAYGWSKNYKTKSKAFKRSQRECKKVPADPSSCRKILLSLGEQRRRGAGARIAVESVDGSAVADFGWGVARTKSKAYTKALKDCGPNCKKRAWTCTKR